MLIEIALLLSAPADLDADIAALLVGVEVLEQVGVPGPVVAFGPKAFPVLTDGRGEAVVAAARFGAGRVVAIGHGGYIGEPSGESGRGRLMRNAIAWTSSGTPEARVAALSEGLALDAIDVVTWPGSDMSAATQARLREFVRGGGGLVVGSCPWGWQQLRPQLSLREDYSANLVLAPMGLVFGPTYLSGPFPIAASRIELAHAGRALRELEQSGRTEAFGVLERALQSVPANDSLFLPAVEAFLATRADFALPSEERPLARSDSISRLNVARWSRHWEDAAVEEIEAAPGAELFPGTVPADTPRATRILYIEAIVPGWTSTGAYALPGEAVSVRAKEGSLKGWSLRIGAHTDSIAHHETWKRWPSVSRRFELEADEARVASPFGGLIYFEAGRGAAPMHVELEGVIEAPLFDGRAPMSAEDWKSERNAPAPWAEIAGEFLILTVPSAAIRELDDPARLAKFWDDVVRAHYQLAARPLPKRPERFVADVQISAGYMHSGYPIMTWLDVTRPSAGRPLGLTLDVERLESSGSWGHFHELGHNCQRGDWTFAGTGEVTCNLFTLHAMERVVGLVTWEVDWLEGQKPSAAPFLAAGAAFDDWKRRPGLALLMYAQIQREFGWQPFYDVFAEYESLRPRERPRGDDEKRDQWMVRLSRAIGRDLGPFFERWGIPVSAAARAQVSELESWMPDFEALSRDT